MQKHPSLNKQPFADNDKTVLGAVHFDEESDESSLYELSAESVEKTVIDDETWFKLEQLLPPYRTGRPSNNDRNFIEAVYWIVKTGAPWRDLPKSYGSWKTTYNRYNNWAKRGCIEDILTALRKYRDNEWLILANKAAGVQYGSSGIETSNNSL